MIKKVKQSLFATAVDMGGIPVKQPIPTQKTAQINPFLLLHHASVDVPQDRPLKQLGIGPHPHRGFSPVTFVYKGGVLHQDSLGTKSEIYEGGVQWMNAGRGIIHSERPSSNIAEFDFKQEIIQLWINTPKYKKMEPPKYLGRQDKEIPRINFGEGIDAKLVAGTYGEQPGSIIPETPLLIIQLSMDEGKEVKIEIPDGFNSSFYQLEGEVNIDGFGIHSALYLTEFEKEGSYISFKANTKSQILLLAGLPINEPVAQFGPYVMNNQTEIMEALRDFNMGKFGFFVED